MTLLFKGVLLAFLWFHATSAFAGTRELTLRNGLRVTLTQVSNAARVGVWLNVAVGAADEDAGARGIAHLAEHLFVRGPSGSPAFAARAAALGGEGVNAGTGFDATNFYWTVPREALREALQLEAERLRDPGAAVSSAVLDKERRIVLAEMRESDWSLDTRVKRIAFPILYGERHPHALLPDGRPSDLHRLDASDLRAFLRRWYRPATTRLIIAGDFDLEAAADMIEHAFDPISAAEGANPTHATFPMTMAPRRKTRLKLEADTASVTFYGVAPGREYADNAPLEKAVAALRAPFADSARQKFGPTVNTILAYRASARTGNVMLRLAFPGRSPPAGAEEFLRDWISVAKISEAPSTARPRSPLHPAPGTVLSSAYELLVDDEAADTAFASTTISEANAAFQRWFAVPMLTVTTLARAHSAEPLAPAAKAERWTVTPVTDLNPGLVRIDVRGPKAGRESFAEIEDLKRAFLEVFRERLGWTYQVRHDATDADSQKSFCIS